MDNHITLGHYFALVFVAIVLFAPPIASFLVLRWQNRKLLRKGINVPTKVVELFPARKQQEAESQNIPLHMDRAA